MLLATTSTHEQTTRTMQVGFSAVRFSSEAAKTPAESLYKGAFCRPSAEKGERIPKTRSRRRWKSSTRQNTSGRGGRLLVTLRGGVFLRGPEDTCGELVRGGVLSTKGSRQASAPPNRGGGSLPTRTNLGARRSVVGDALRCESIKTPAESMKKETLNRLEWS